MSDYKRLEISAVTYECVSRKELQDKDRETLEMIIDICDSVRDQDFRTETNTHQLIQKTGSACVRNRISRAASVYLVLLCSLLLTAVIVPCLFIYTNYTNYTQERNQLLTNTKNVTELNEKLLQEKHNLLKCFNDGWTFHQSRCYFISSEEKNWTESRRDCQQRGADLIVINNREEQRMCDDKVWIGLTDSDEEGRWKWVDGTNMTSGFWNSREPNGDRKENCALTHKSEWFDYSCNHHFKFICEICFLK